MIERARMRKVETVREPADAVADHRRACQGLTTVVGQVPADAWNAPTPCSEWDAQALVEHVIGFHEFLLLRPLGVRAQRPREGPAARWLATVAAIDAALRHPGLRGEAAYFDGDSRRPFDVLGAITADVVIHTWDLARSVGAPDRLDLELCSVALDAARATTAASDRSGLFAPPVPIRSDARTQDRLVALRGRDPGWCPPTPP
jgi:uncharacterized protein (TIGR03086 family)